MMKTKKNFPLLIFSIVYYLFFLALMIVGTWKDVAVDLAVFQPESSFARLAESFGQFVYWGMWGPAFTVIILCRHDLYELITLFEKHSKTAFCREIKNEKPMNGMNIVFKTVYYVLFYVLAVIGWKKLIQNVTKNILLDMGRENLSEAVYFVISAVVAALAILVCSRIDQKTLRKLEGAAFIGIFMGILCKITEELKPLTERVRFREMVAYSNGYLNENGLSEGKYSPLTSAMVANTDFSAFTPWYKKGDAMGLYSRADSFPSGHTCYACTLFLSYVFCTLFDKLKKAAPFMLILGFAYVALMGFSRMIAGAHYLTDVASAALIGYTAFLLARTVCNFLLKKIR